MSGTYVASSIRYYVSAPDGDEGPVRLFVTPAGRFGVEWPAPVGDQASSAVERESPAAAAVDYVRFRDLHDYWRGEEAAWRASGLEGWEFNLQKHLLRSFEDLVPAWRATGVSDADLRGALGERWGIQSGWSLVVGGRGFQNVSGGANPRYWREPGGEVYQGALLLALVRRLLGVPEPGRTPAARQLVMAL